MSWYLAELISFYRTASKQHQIIIAPYQYFGDISDAHPCMQLHFVTKHTDHTDMIIPPQCTMPGLWNAFRTNFYLPTHPNCLVFWKCCLTVVFETWQLQELNKLYSFKLWFWGSFLHNPPHSVGGQCAHESKSWHIFSTFKHGNLPLMAVILLNYAWIILYINYLICTGQQPSVSFVSKIWLVL